jgi:chemosensory pili system protein ChpA (sensor histidine kinase/response regulator)
VTVRVQAPPVLVVDDDEDIRTLVCLVLGSEGYRAVPARDGVDALRILEETDRPALILLDIMMPRMDGEQLIAALRSAGLAHIPVVIMSGHNEARQKTRTAGAAGCLVKPVDIDVLVSTVRRFAAPNP